MDYVLKTENLTKKFGKQLAVNNVNLTVKKGDIYGLIGKNGAGKTTLMRCILSLAFPSGGIVSLFNGEDFSVAGKRIGSLIEAPALMKNCTAKENLYRYSILYGADVNKIPEILEFVGLKDASNKAVYAFSLGMKQRLGIAIAMLNDPEFLVLDEPVNGLDPEGIAEVRNLIIKLNKEKGVTFLISSHILEELSKTATVYGIIDKGKLIEEVSTVDLAVKYSSKLILSVDRPSDALEFLKVNNLGVTGSVENGKLILNSVISPAEINKQLCLNGFSVSELRAETQEIEDYFIKKVGG